MRQTNLLVGLAASVLALAGITCASPPELLPPSNRLPSPDVSATPAALAIKTGIATGTVPPGTAESPTSPTEVPVQIIPLEGPLKFANAEVSGLAWFGDRLVILPQYPERFPGAGSAATLFSLAKSDIVGYLEGAIPGPLEPSPIAFDAAGVPAKIEGFEGFEAMAFSGDRVFLTIEARRLDTWTGYLVTGTISPDGTAIRLDPESTVAIMPPVDLVNKSDEALVVAGGEVLSLFEANGSSVNPQPVAHVFDQTNLSLRQVPMASVEYRITDATPADENGQFWALNVFWLGEIMLLPRQDPIAIQFGEGPSHAESSRVERLLRFRFSGSRIDLVDQAPIQLELEPGVETRNWEGLAVLDHHGFLLMTDEFPTTILAFLPWP